MIRLEKSDENNHILSVGEERPYDRVSTEVHDVDATMDRREWEDQLQCNIVFMQLVGLL